MRVDKKTGKKYTSNNIPFRSVTGITTHKGTFCIKNESTGHEQDTWYNDTFLGDRYAVFEYNEQARFWQQLTPWYVRFGYAQRKLFELSK